MDIRLYATAPTAMVSERGQLMTLPAGYSVFSIDCSLLDRGEGADLIRVRKQVRLDGGEYVSETLVNAGDLLDALPAGRCMLESVFNVVPGTKTSLLLPLVKGARVMDDSRSDAFFALRSSPEGTLELCRLWKKYYSASIDIFVSLSREGSLRDIHGILHTNVTITNTAGEPVIDHGTPIYFTIPADLLLWNNNMVIAEEDGEKFWSRNGIPMVEQWRPIDTGQAC